MLSVKILNQLDTDVANYVYDLQCWQSMRPEFAKIKLLFTTKNVFFQGFYVGGAVASWLVRLTLDRAVWVPALARDIVLCSWAGHLTLTAPLFTQVYKWVPANLMLGVTLRWTSIPSRGE